MPLLLPKKIRPIHPAHMNCFKSATPSPGFRPKPTWGFPFLLLNLNNLCKYEINRCKGSGYKKRNYNGNSKPHTKQKVS